MKEYVTPIYYLGKKTYINIFDISDIIIYFHIKLNLRIFLPRLLALLFFYKTRYDLPKQYKTAPPFEEDIEVKNNYVFIYDINRKYRKYKKESLPISQIFFDKFEANIKTRSNLATKTAEYLVSTYASKNDKELKKEVQNILQNEKYIKY